MFQIFDGPTVPQRTVDGWNAFFCDDLSDLVSLATRAHRTRRVPERLRMRAGERACCESVVCWQHRVLSELQPNSESVGELWLGLLRFYTEEFDFKEHVISIRQKKRLTTFEKQWTSKCIAIEGARAAAAPPAPPLCPLTPLPPPPLRPLRPEPQPRCRSVS